MVPIQIKWMTSPDKFDFVTTDTTMSNMTGVQLAKKLLGIRSDIPIIDGFVKRPFKNVVFQKAKSKVKNIISYFLS